MRKIVMTYVGWAVVWSAILYFIYSNAIRYYNPDFPVYTDEFSAFAPYLVLHITAGMVALLIGPFQFYSFIRVRHPRVHRTIGKIYLSAVLISGVSAIYLAISDNILRKAEFTFGTGVLGLAIAWLITSGMALFAVKNRNFVQHQEWMIRSYVVTNGFVFFRIIFDSLLAIDQFPFKNEIAGVSAWACWSVPLLVTEWVLQAKKIKRQTTKVMVPVTQSLRGEFEVDKQV